MYTLVIAPIGFPSEYTAYIANEQGEMVDTGRIVIDDLASYAIARGDINHIVIQGKNEYCLGIKEETEKKLALEYANNNIKVEVM